MRPYAICLAALAWGIPAAASARPVPYAAVPVVVETQTYSYLPRALGKTPDVDVGHLLVGAEAPANVDVYALTEDEVGDIPVASIERRVVLRPLYPRRAERAWRGPVLRVRG